MRKVLEQLLKEYQNMFKLKKEYQEKALVSA